ncbi:MAG: hypothetical protein PHS93_00020 [Candidatus Omnitrophica bacterium]|nr:hypothetical protein [Candidatus Omnitrophota bacterium]MDD5351547.1 hypothetical protein [Candidatus Omnitrophota bacterium]MDD5550982.1 hypothetical protein [Candidatus Omnitrophota bacterium]
MKKINCRTKTNFKTFGLSRKTAASTLEYVVLIAIIVAALMAMQFYLRRAICGSFRSTADTFGQGRQYEPSVTTVTEN